MRVAPLNPSSTFGLDPNLEAQNAEKSAEAGGAQGKPAIDPEKLRLAREFEQIFIRKMLSSLEKSGQSHNGSPAAGGSAYGSMVVNALAEAVSKGGGVGLAEVIAKAASQPVAAGPATSTGATNAIQSAIANATGASSAAQSLGAARITVPENVRITVSPPPTTTTYPRPAPVIIHNENNDIHDLFKVPNR